MGRVFFPTYRANVIGVRDIGPATQLAGMDGSIVIPRAPAEPYPRAANSPTGRMLGALPSADPISDMIRFREGGSPWPGPMPVWPGYGVPIYRVTPLPLPPQAPPVTALPGAPASSAPPSAPPAVSSQGSPTPVVTMPPQSQPGAILVSSGGGTAAPSTAPITIQTDSSTGAIASWLQGSTTLFNYPIPNALLAFAAVLGFAWLSSGTGKKR